MLTKQKIEIQVIPVCYPKVSRTGVRSVMKEFIEKAPQYRTNLAGLKGFKDSGNKASERCA